MKWNFERYPLRGYQQQFCRSCYDAWDGRSEGGPFSRILGVAGTGAGKTIMAAAIIFKEVLSRGRVLFLADRDELVGQACDKLHSATGIVPDREQGSERAELTSPVVVASVQSLSKPSRLDRFPPDHFSLVICDEAHLSLAPNWQRILSRFCTARVLGITATPSRGDKKQLLGFYETVAHRIDLFDLINLQALVPIRVLNCDIQPDMTGVKMGEGEDMEDVAEALEPYWNAILDRWQEHASDRKTLIFHPSRLASRRFTDLCLARRIPAAHVQGDSPDRREKLEAYAAGRYKILNNAILLSTGYDEPTIRCILNLRPGKSRTTYQQIVGRGTRLFCPKGCNLYCNHEDAKRDLLLMDVMWQFEELGICSPADLITESDEQAAAIRDKIRATPGRQLTLADIDAQVTGEREQAMIKALRATQGRGPRSYDARTVAALLHAPALADYEPAAQWERNRPTPRQIEFMNRQGVDCSKVQSRGEASAIIATITERFERDLCSLKQAAFLADLGFDNPASFTFQAAARAIEGKTKKGTCFA